MADEPQSALTILRRKQVVDITKPCRWLMNRPLRRKASARTARRHYKAVSMANKPAVTAHILASAHSRHYKAVSMANKPERLTLPPSWLLVDITKPCRWLINLYLSNYLIILHAPPSLRELSAEAGQGMPNSL